MLEEFKVTSHHRGEPQLNPYQLPKFYHLKYPTPEQKSPRHGNPVVPEKHLKINRNWRGTRTLRQLSDQNRNLMVFKNSSNTSKAKCLCFEPSFLIRIESLPNPGIHHAHIKITELTLNARWATVGRTQRGCGARQSAM